VSHLSVSSRVFGSELRVAIVTSPRCPGRRIRDTTAPVARRAIQYYYTYILEEYDDVHEVPVEDLTFDGADQAKAGLTIGAEKHEIRRAKTE
jgi:hypothetical protein